MSEAQELTAKPNGSAPTEQKPKTLVRKLCEVMAGLKRIPKRGHNAFHNYDYVMEADLCDAVREELAKRNVLILPSVEDEERIQLTEKQVLTRVEMKYRIIDGDNGEIFETTVFGYGSDAGDKGIYKAITGATKYMLMKTFLIATGDDPEGDERVDKAIGKEAAKQVAKQKIEAAKGQSEASAALFYTLPESYNGDYFCLMGDKTLLSNWKEWLLSMPGTKWSTKAGGFIMPIDHLASVQYQAEKDSVALKELRNP